MKEVWSNRYGTNPKEGLHQWFERKSPAYRRSQLAYWIAEFAKHKEVKNNHPKYVSQNFDEFKKFVLEHNFVLPKKLTPAP